MPDSRLLAGSSHQPSRECIERVENEGNGSELQSSLDGAGSPSRGFYPGASSAPGFEQPTQDPSEQPMSPPNNLRAHGVLPVTSDDSHNHLFQVGQFVERDVEIILDSGCCEHVMDAEHAPGYPVLPSPGSLRGQNFFVGNGEPLPNEGQVNLRFGARDEAGEMRDLTSVFQVAEVTSPLMSVSSICDKGFTCVFDAKCGRVLDEDGATVCTFDRCGGLYATTVKLQPPEPFHRPA